MIRHLRPAYGPQTEEFSSKKKQKNLRISPKHHLSSSLLPPRRTQNAICCPSVSSTGPGPVPALKAPFTHPLTQGCFCNSIFSHAGCLIVTLEPYTWQDEADGVCGGVAPLGWRGWSVERWKHRGGFEWGGGRGQRRGILTWVEGLRGATGG